MAGLQQTFKLAERRDAAEENEQDREARLLRRVLKVLEQTVDEEIGRAQVCYALHLSEQLLSKQFSGAEGKEPRATLILYALKHAKTERLASAVTEYSGHLPLQRPEQVDPEQAMRDVVALALAGEMGNAGREKVLAIYARMKGGAR